MRANRPKRQGESRNAAARKILCGHSRGGQSAQILFSIQTAAGGAGRPLRPLRGVRDLSQGRLPAHRSRQKRIRPVQGAHARDRAVRRRGSHRAPQPQRQNPRQQKLPGRRRGAQRQHSVFRRGARAGGRADLLGAVLGGGRVARAAGAAVPRGDAAGRGLAARNRRGGQCPAGSDRPHGERRRAAALRSARLPGGDAVLLRGSLGAAPGGKARASEGRARAGEGGKAGSRAGGEAVDLPQPALPAARRPAADPAGAGAVRAQSPPGPQPSGDHRRQVAALPLRSAGPFRAGADPDRAGGEPRGEERGGPAQRLAAAGAARRADPLPVRAGGHERRDGGRARRGASERRQSRAERSGGPAAGAAGRSGQAAQGPRRAARKAQAGDSPGRGRLPRRRGGEDPPRPGGAGALRAGRSALQGRGRDRRGRHPRHERRPV